eukprot:1864885-Prymnesium_polylepis.1
MRVPGRCRRQRAIIRANTQVLAEVSNTRANTPTRVKWAQRAKLWHLLFLPCCRLPAAAAAGCRCRCRCHCRRRCRLAPLREGYPHRNQICGRFCLVRARRHRAEDLVDLRLKSGELQTRIIRRMCYHRGHARRLWRHALWHRGRRCRQWLRRCDHGRAKVSTWWIRGRMWAPGTQRAMLNCES